jgi:hypothetical protein
LQDIGDFSREACAEALQNSFYDVNRACIFLVGQDRPQPQHEMDGLSEFMREHGQLIDNLCKGTNLTRAEVIQIHYLNRGDENLTRALLASC